MTELQEFPLSGSLQWIWNANDDQLQLLLAKSDQTVRNDSDWTSVAINVNIPVKQSVEWAAFKDACLQSCFTASLKPVNEFGKYTVTLVRHFPNEHANESRRSLIDQCYHLMESKRSSYVKNASLKVLMSVLQKNVRLQKPAAAVRTVVAALQRGEQGVLEVLRRLPIVIVEDALVHPLLPNVVWLMMAVSKGYRLRKSDHLLLLLITYEICLPGVPCDMRCRVLTSHWKLHTASASLCSLPQVRLAQPFSLLVRSAYGGMTCDLDMLFKAFTVWIIRQHPAIDTNQNLQIRFLSIPKAFTELYSSQSFHTNVQLKLLLEIVTTPFSVEKDAPLTAIDHHATSIIPDLIELYGKEYDFYRPSCYKQLENLIWDHRSSLTTRTCAHCEKVCWDIKKPQELGESSNLPIWWSKLTSPNNPGDNRLSLIDQYCMNFWQTQSSTVKRSANFNTSRPKKMKLDMQRMCQMKLSDCISKNSKS